MNSRNLFYVRKLQSKFYFKKNEIVKSLFFLENFLFSLIKQNDEDLVRKIKIKWIYDQIKNNNFSNELTKNFYVFKDLVLKNKILSIIEIFLEIDDQENLYSILKFFKKFNLIFNSVIKFSGSSFKTSIYFQFFQYVYKNKFQNLDELKNKKLISHIYVDDNFEFIFIKLIHDYYFLKKKKPTKTIYLFYLLISFFKKYETKVF